MEDVEERLFKKLKKMIRPETGISNYTDSEVKEYVETLFDLKVQIMEDVPSSPSVLSKMEQQQINFEELDNKQEVVVCFTPVIERLSNQHDLIFVNSEEHSWIHDMTGEIDEFHRPDGFSAPASLYNDASQDSRVELATWKERHPTTYRYGGGIWEIRDFYLLWEFRATISPADRGTAYRYLLQMCRGNKFSVFYCILCDKTDFYIIKAQAGLVVSSNKWEWVQPGSQQALSAALAHRNHWFKLYLSSIQLANVTVLGFLGSGGYGRVFHVRQDDGVDFALKIALTVKPDPCGIQEMLIVTEYENLCFLAALGVDHVVGVKNNSLHQSVSNGIPIGFGYLMTTVGRPITLQECKNRAFCERLLFSLQVIHQSGFRQGDAKYTNVILFSDKIFWIDFMNVTVGVGSTSQQKRNDIVTLIESILPDVYPSQYSDLLTQYGEVTAKEDNNLKQHQQAILGRILDRLFFC
jgi:hypothetical protein